MNEPLDQVHANPKPKANPFAKIVLRNFAVMLLYMIGGGLISGRNSEGFDALLLASQVLLNLFAGLGSIFSKTYRMTGIAFLLSGLLVAVIGPGMCGYKQTLLSKTEITPAKPI